eukprot:CAMPEP_0204531580 /NCGR_PEP_ID=MMETSP0661-20131031/11249_1 /ASSEMBLY_ACC=CAM_ASM_000606 /TAXON_ID=109239 /ORGANISM="Alexandrium margalefi, Strain AMGDE01CS-322" /LENGTH=205 /DNA_ID=CAMNT_0051537747 /DNA_START=73 /DNA_END=690 /DNA_ORIENTATION=-
MGSRASKRPEDEERVGVEPEVSQDGQEPDMLEVEVLQGVSGERLCAISTGSDWAVQHLKAAIEQQTGIAVGQQRLLTGTDPLSNDEPDLWAALRGKSPTVTLIAVENPWPALEKRLHGVIQGRVRTLPDGWQLPSLGEMSLGGPGMYVAVPGMYGGFSIQREGGETDKDAHPVLQVESWSRVCSGSGQRHIIDADGARLVAEGFV